MVAKLLAEFLGTALIVTTVLGAGFSQMDLGAEPALGLLVIALSVAAVLFVAISIFGPISGAHFNPIVSLALAARKETDAGLVILYISFQLLGALAGALLANQMFATPTTLSEVSRISPAVFLGEVVASAGLVLIILLLIHHGQQSLMAGSVALWILAGHLFVSSTSFANPAVTIGRILTASPSGIDVQSALWFLLAQVIGLVVAIIFSAGLTRKAKSSE